MKTYMKIHRLLLGAFAVAALAAFAASPALASSPGISQHVKLKAHMKAHKRAHRLARGGAPATETVGVSSFGAIKAAAKEKPEEKESSGACPSTTNLGEAEDVGASLKPEGEKTYAYYFESFKKEEVSPGVPGLMKYCVYPTTGPESVKAIYPGWLASKGKKGSSPFSFSRPGGNSTNIPYDENNYKVGTATWTGIPPKVQIIVLHINDEAECHRLYGSGSSVTCFVLPGERPGPRCGAGDESLAFNNYPFDIIQACPARTAFGVEANPGTLEYGNGVVLDATSGEHITSLTVPFYSFACGVSGHWYSGDCVTNPGQTFSIPASPGDPTDEGQAGGVLARLYEVTNGNEVGALLGTARYTGEFPYRPSADNVNCTGTNAGKWFNEEAEPPRCQNMYGALIPFHFSGVTVPAGGEVIWTVSFNTTSSGYQPFGALECRTNNGGNPGCGYDALNVGADSTYAGAPYAGEDMEIPTLYYKNAGGSEWPKPQTSPEDPGEAPLAQITTAP